MLMFETLALLVAWLALIWFLEPDAFREARTRPQEVRVSRRF
jgi:hypothetical protein